MTAPRIFTATLPDNRQVLVTLWPEGGEIAFRESPDGWVRWGIPTALVEEVSDAPSEVTC